MSGLKWDTDAAFSEAQGTSWMGGARTVRTKGWRWMLWGAIFWIWHGCWNHQHTAGVTMVGRAVHRGREGEGKQKETDRHPLSLHPDLNKQPYSPRVTLSLPWRSTPLKLWAKAIPSWAALCPESHSSNEKQCSWTYVRMLRVYFFMFFLNLSSGRKQKIFPVCSCFCVLFWKREAVFLL